MLKLGWIRFLRLYGIEPILKELLPTAEEIQIKITSVIMELLAMICAYAGCMYYMEAYDSQQNGFTTLLDFVYFSVVTLSTVGYGDFSPTQPMSRVITIFFIMLILSVIPKKYNQIADLWNAKPLVIGALPPKYAEHILILGPIQPAMMTTFL